MWGVYVVAGFSPRSTMGTKHHRLPRECYRRRVCTSYTLRVEERKWFFVSSDMIQVFLVCLDKVAEKYAFRAIYCFMPDHLHLIALGNSDNTDLLRAVEEFKQRTGYWLHKHPPFVYWQKSFYDPIIRANELVAHVNYVLDNPMRWGCRRLA